MEGADFTLAKFGQQHKKYSYLQIHEYFIYFIW